MCLSTPKAAFQSAPAVSRHTMPKRSNRRSTSAAALVCGSTPTRDQRPASMTRTRRRTVFFTFPDSVASISRTGRKLSARHQPARQKRLQRVSGVDGQTGSRSSRRARSAFAGRPAPCPSGRPAAVRTRPRRPANQTVPEPAPPKRRGKPASVRRKSRGRLVSRFRDARNRFDREPPCRAFAHGARRRKPPIL